MSALAEMADHIHDRALRAEADNARLRALVKWCRPRLKRDAYRDRVDAVLADPSLMDPDPEMAGRLVQSAEQPSAGGSKNAL